MPIPPHVQARRAALAAIAQETKDVLPDILKQLPHLDATMSYQEELCETKPLDPADCPGFTLASDPATRGTLVKVLNEDSLDAAIMMADSLTQQSQPQYQQASAASPGSTSSTPPRPPYKPSAFANRPRNQRVLVLNLASDKSPGGGWLTGAVAQEEAICYRSSLALSLHKTYYPWTPLMGLYTRDVVVIRSSMGAGHQLLLPKNSTATTSSSTTTAAAAPTAADAAATTEATASSSTAAVTSSSTAGITSPSSLPILSVVSIAGIRKPELRKVLHTTTTTAPRPREKYIFKRPSDRQLTKDKMRLSLRIAAAEGHELLVLGALGCGAFHNPPEEIAECWMEVLNDDPEFGGGWFREIWLAVFDNKREGNFEVFEKVLGGREVGKVAVGK